jgi:hypothetical protein
VKLQNPKKRPKKQQQLQPNNPRLPKKKKKTPSKKTKSTKSTTEKPKKKRKVSTLANAAVSEGGTAPVPAELVDVETLDTSQKIPELPVQKLPLKISFKAFQQPKDQSGPIPMQDSDFIEDDAGEDSQAGTSATAPEPIPIVPIVPIEPAKPTNAPLPL